MRRKGIKAVERGLTLAAVGFRERNYRNLKVWIAAHGAAVRIYAVTKEFPESERFGLVTQLRRSFASVASNLAEGSARTSAAGFASFVEIAFASASEADYQLLLARDVGYLSDDMYARLAADVDEIRRMLAALRRVLRATTPQQVPAVPPRLSANR